MATKLAPRSNIVPRIECFENNLAQNRAKGSGRGPDGPAKMAFGPRAFGLGPGPVASLHQEVRKVRKQQTSLLASSLSAELNLLLFSDNIIVLFYTRQ